MPGYQFVHIEAYGLSASKRKSKDGKEKHGGDSKWTIREVLDEAMRVPGTCNHVLTPQPPIEMLAVIPLSKLETEVQRRKDASVDSIDRKVRVDALCLLSGVTSYPIKVADLQTTEDKMQAFEFFETAIEFLKKKFGEWLVNVTVHMDEEFPHCHFYCLPEAGRGTFNMIGIHPGITAKEMTGPAKKGGSYEQRKLRDLAYTKAMRRFQDDFHENVASRFGMARIGPKRRRLTRPEWQANQKENELMAERVRNLEAELDEAKKLVLELQSRLMPGEKSIAQNPR